MIGSFALVAGIAGVVLLGGDVNGREPSSSGASPEASEASGVVAGPGTTTLGSNLRTPPGNDRWYCTGSGADSPACVFAVTRLPEVDQLIKAPFDGVVTRWQVRGAGGPIRLVVLRGAVRPGGRSSLRRVQGSAEQQVRGGGRHGYETRLEITKGDVVGLQLSVGAYGNAPYAQGTWLEEWIPPLGPEPRESLDESGHDYELLYNASVEPDKVRDGFGDATQDDCPKDPDRQEGC